MSRGSQLDHFKEIRSVRITDIRYHEVVNTEGQKEFVPHIAPAHLANFRYNEAKLADTLRLMERDYIEKEREKLGFCATDIAEVISYNDDKSVTVKWRSDIKEDAGCLTKNAPALLHFTRTEKFKKKSEKVKKATLDFLASRKIEAEVQQPQPQQIPTPADGTEREWYTAGILDVDLDASEKLVVAINWLPSNINIMDMIWDDLRACLDYDKLRDTIGVEAFNEWLSAEAIPNIGTLRDKWKKETITELWKQHQAKIANKIIARQTEQAIRESAREAHAAYLKQRALLNLETHRERAERRRLREQRAQNNVRIQKTKKGRPSKK